MWYQNSIEKKAYTDIKEWRSEPIKHLYIHGGIEDSELRFSFYFPPKEQYEGRFYHFVAPVHGSENASQIIEGDDKIEFSIRHGGYFVESNMGGPEAEGKALYQNSAAAAEYSRIIAEELYGDSKPYGYLFGGSGGGYKTISFLENVPGVWDGAVPFVIGTPQSIPNNFTVRAHAMRILRKKLPLIVAALEPGGSQDMYAGLDAEEKEALLEITKMGFPPRTWFAHSFIGDGALAVLAPEVSKADPTYYQDFWSVPGYLGADPIGSARRDRIQFITKITKINIPDVVERTEQSKTGVDDAWHIYGNLDQFVADPELELAEVPVGELYLQGTQVCILDGEAVGERLPFGSLNGNTLTIGQSYKKGLRRILQKIRIGDTVILDNSDYIALQTYHRHQVPEEHFEGWKQFCDESGKPMYPQRPLLVGPLIAEQGAGSVQTGKFQGKMIVVESLMDESAFPWNGDWYRSKVKEHLQENEADSFRLWYLDHAMHAETEGSEAKLHAISYGGAIYQALLDVSAWVEKGVTPPESTAYTVRQGQVLIPEKTEDRKGIQPVVTLEADGGSFLSIALGTSVVFKGKIEVPDGAGQVISAEWDFDGKGIFDTDAQLEFVDENKSCALTEATYVYSEPGNYSVVLRASSGRNIEDTFSMVKNIERVRVIVI